MRRIIPIAVILAVLCDQALASQGPGTGPGTAGPLLQAFAVLCVFGLATLGVIFARWDDGKYGDFGN